MDPDETLAEQIKKLRALERALAEAVTEARTAASDVARQIEDARARDALLATHDRPRPLLD